MIRTCFSENCWESKRGKKSRDMEHAGKATQLSCTYLISVDGHQFETIVALPLC